MWSGTAQVGCPRLLNTERLCDEQTKQYSDYANDAQYWKDIVSNLRMVGYDYVVGVIKK